MDFGNKAALAVSVNRPWLTFLVVSLGVLFSSGSCCVMCCVSGKYAFF